MSKSPVMFDVLRWDDTGLPFSGNSCRPFRAIRRFWALTSQIASDLDACTIDANTPFEADSSVYAAPPDRHASAAGRA